MLRIFLTMLLALVAASTGPAMAQERKVGPRGRVVAEASEDTSSRARRARGYARRDDDAYAARAAEGDPSGTYKALPNWARTALGTKPYGR